MARSNLLQAGGYATPTLRGKSLDTVTTGSRGLAYARVTKDTQADVKKDWRVRITLPPESKFAFNNDTMSSGLMYPLANLSEIPGVIFPYTPQVTITHNARYSEQALTHSNYKNYFYEGSDIAAISIAGVFTCQNEQEALYLMGAIQFLRACTKMFFGKDDQKAGTPPTLVRLHGYGEHYIPSINCVVTSVSHTMPDDCDYIQYTGPGKTQGRMPTLSTLTVTLQPVVSRKRQSEGMKLDNFVQGSYLGENKFGTPMDTPEGGIF